MGRTLIISGGVSGGHVSTAELAVTWDEVIWAALTIGRPSTHHVFQHGASSRYEAIFRLSLVRMALEQYGPTAKRLRRTEAYKGLDPTEKGAVRRYWLKYSPVPQIWASKCAVSAG